MSRNSKNAQRIIQAREMSNSRKKGNHGPAKTEAKHGKKKAWWQLFSSYSDFVKNKGRPARKQNSQSSTEVESAIV